MTGRPNSRLEIDDEQHCKRCGWELPKVCFTHEFHPLGGDEPPEYCGKCLAEVTLEGVA